MGRRKTLFISRWATVIAKSGSLHHSVCVLNVGGTHKDPSGSFSPAYLSRIYADSLLTISSESTTHHQ